jgi:hypothetical protein
MHFGLVDAILRDLAFSEQSIGKALPYEHLPLFLCLSPRNVVPRAYRLANHLPLFALTAAAFERLFLRLLCRHQTQVCGGADFSCVDETNFLEGRQVLFDRHEMGGSMTGARGRIGVIANQNGSSGKQQAVELSIKLRDAARVAELVDGLERDDEIEAGANPRRPIGFFEIRLDENRPVLKLCQASAAKVQHLRREVDQRVARDLTMFQQCFGEKSRSAAELENQ